MVHAPAVGPIAFARGVRSRGFLNFAGDLWREHGDVFEAHVGPRRLVFVMHPDAVEQVTVSGRQRYDKKGSYDVVRKYLIRPRSGRQHRRSSRDASARACAMGSYRTSSCAAR